MPTPGYYKTNTSAATIGEMVRMRGVFALPLTFVLMKFIMRPKGGVWMPSVCAETDCKPDELSPRLWQATEQQRNAFERLGFSPCFYSRLVRNLDPMYLDQGSITYLHSGRFHLGTLVYARLQLRAPVNQVREVVVTGITAAFRRGCVSFTNSKARFDPLPGRIAVFVKSGDPAAIYQRFLSHLSRQSQTPRLFSGCDAVREWLDECRLDSFKAGVERGLYLRLTEDEVEQARSKMTH
jgi:hypothetical protein